MMYTPPVAVVRALTDPVLQVPPAAKVRIRMLPLTAITVHAAAVVVHVITITVLPVAALPLPNRARSAKRTALPVCGVPQEAVLAAVVLLLQEAVAPAVPAVPQATAAKQKMSELFVYLPNNSLLCTAFAQSLSGHREKPGMLRCNDQTF